MTGINHALTGATVAVAIDKPILALPAALLSHFVIDMLPHWDYRLPHRNHLKRMIMMGDILASCFLLLVLSILLFNKNPWLIVAGGFLGILPDAMWLPQVITGKKIPMNRPTFFHSLRRLHAKFQLEPAFGPYFEVAWFFLVLVLIFKIG